MSWVLRDEKYVWKQNAENRHSSWQELGGLMWQQHLGELRILGLEGLNKVEKYFL